MPYDEGAAQLMRDSLGEAPGITERKMFGGLCFQQHGHMVCGVHKGGAMFRVGKAREADALAIEGAREMDFTKRRMPGFIEVTDDGLADDTSRQAWLGMALAYVAELPPK